MQQPGASAGHDRFIEIFDDNIDDNDTDNFPAFIDGVDDQSNLMGPFAVSRKATVLAALTAARVGRGDVVLDIGSGDGRFCVAAVLCFDATHAVGVELDPQLVTLANTLAQRCGVADRVSFLAQDFTTLDDLSALSPPSSGIAAPTATAVAIAAAAATGAAAAAAAVTGSVAIMALGAGAALAAGVGTAAAAAAAVGTGTALASEAADVAVTDEIPSSAVSGEQQAAANSVGTSSACRSGTVSTENSASPGTSDCGAPLRHSAGTGVGPSSASGGVTVAVVYLLPGSEGRFKQQLSRLYDSGARIVAIHFPIPGLHVLIQGDNFKVYQRPDVISSVA